MTTKQNIKTEKDIITPEKKVDIPISSVKFAKSWTFWESYVPKSKSIKLSYDVTNKQIFKWNDLITFFQFWNKYPGKINGREIRGAMMNIGYDEKNPVVYEVMSELDNSRSKNAGGATFNDFCQTVNYRVPERESTEDLRRVFNLFLDDPNSNTTSLESIKRVADELGENIEELELNAMLNKASKAGAKLTFDDFVAIMTGNQNS